MSWLDHLMVVPVTVIHAARQTSPYGVDEPDWDAATEAEHLGWVQAGRGAEEADWSGGRDQQTYEAIAWLPAGTAVVGRDRLTVGAEIFEVVGPPQRRLAPWHDREHHVRVELRRLEGPGAEEGSSG